MIARNVPLPVSSSSPDLFDAASATVFVLIRDNP
jgi:hypothetical protein